MPYRHHHIPTKPTITTAKLAWRVEVRLFALPVNVAIGELVPPLAILCVGDPVPIAAAGVLLALLYPYENPPPPGATGTELGIMAPLPRN